jgi:hypothetical protein
MKKKVSVSIPKDLLLDIEADRGKIPRLLYIEQKLNEAMKEDR